MAVRIIDVAAGIWFREGQFFLAQRRGGSLDGLWEFPGGKREPGESFEEALLREWKEELACTPLNLYFWKETITRLNEQMTIKMQSFLFREIEGVTELREHARADWFFLSALRELDLAPADIDLLPYLNGIPPD